MQYRTQAASPMVSKIASTSKWLPTQRHRVGMALSSTGGALVVALALFPQPASAAGGGDGCNPQRTNNFTNYYFGAELQQQSSSIGGTRGDIYNYSPFVAGADTTGVVDFVMATDLVSRWAQIGWIEYPGSERYTFVQFNDPGVAFWTNLDPSYPINSTVPYTVTYDPTCSASCYAFYAYGTEITSSAHNWTSNASEVAVETHTAADQFPGGSANVEANTYLQQYYGGWNTLEGTPFTTNGGSTGSGTGPAPSWANISGSAGQFYTWDSQCSN